jgi:signal peptidase I
VIIIIGAILVRTYFVRAYYIKSGSMEGELYEGDFIFVNHLIYNFSLPENGDIIAFKYPNNPTRDFLKRVVAGPGQIVEVRDKILYVDHVIASWPKHAKYVDSTRVLSGEFSFRDNFGPYEVQPDNWFVMGDNRDASRDSRFWGTIPKENIKGKAMIIYWSWQSNPDAPGWEFPYIIDIVRWTGYIIWNFPTHVRWERLYTSL